MAKESEKDLSEISRLLVCWNEDWGRARPNFDLFKQDYLAYMMFRDPNLHPYKYNPTIPLVFTITENTVSTVFNSFFMKDNVTTIEPVEDTNYPNPNVRDAVIARQLQKVENTLSLHPDREFMLDMYDLSMETALFGTGFTITVPEFDYDETSDIGGPVYVGAKVLPISIWDLVADKECWRLSKTAGCRRVWQKEWVSVAEYKRRAEYANYKKLSDEDLDKLAKDKNWMPESSDIHEDLLSRLGKGAHPRDGWDEKNGNILLLHYYDMETGHYKTIAANRMLVRDTSKPQKVETSVGPITTTIKPYPYCPYDDLRLWPFPKEFYGQGTGRIARGFQDDINLLKSMRLENIEMGIFKPLMVNDLYVDDEDELVMMAGGIWHTRDVNSGIKALDIPDITQHAYTEQAQWQNEAQDATSSFENMRGNETARRETATAYVQLQRNGLKRTETFLKRIGHWYKSVSLKKIIQIRTYMSQREYERITGEPDAGFYQLSINEIKRMFDIRPSSTSIDQVRDMEQQNFINALQMVQGNEDLVQRAAWMRLGMELFFPNKNPDKYIISDQQAQQMQMAGMQGGQPGQGQSPAGPSGGQTINPSQLIDMAANGQIGGQQGSY